MKDITVQYRKLLKHIVNNGSMVINERTGVQVMQCIEKPYTLSINLSSGMIPIMGNRQMYPYIAAAENAWQLSGTKDGEFINKIAPKLWSKFTEEDGTIENAYGYRMARYFGVQQIDKALHLLRNTPSSRQNVISLWAPAIDGVAQAKNVPCIVMLVLNKDILTNKLMMHVYIRSSDTILGLPYDMLTYSFMHFALVNSIDDLEPGIISFILNNYHIYWIESHTDVAFRTIALTKEKDSLHVAPYHNIHDIIDKPFDYVDNVKRYIHANHSFQPKIELVV